ncbi:MAG: hypothetical protein ACQKBW_10795 [Puniceicoccales bacterium]
MFLKASFYSLLVLGLTASASATDYFEAAEVCSMQSQSNAADRFGAVDFSQFVAGSANVPYDYGDTGNPTMKGFAYFDLEDDDLREELEEAVEDGEHVLLSFVLLQVVGKPRPLRVEYIGTFKDKDSDKSRSQQFQANTLHRANNVLEQTAEPGLKLVDVSSVIKSDLDKGRWLIVRFEQDGLRIEDGQDDLYQFNANNSTVRLTVTKDKKMLDKVVNHYQEDGVGGIIADMNTNILPDMSQKPLPKMNNNILPDMSNDPTSDMDTQNILPDMDTKSIIQDQDNQQ